MPLERVSKEFKDVSMTFQANPLNFDIITLKNENAISRSIRNLVLTIPGERFFNQRLGSNVKNLLFENVDPIIISAMEDEIENVIKNYEPRVELISVIVNPVSDTGLTLISNFEITNELNVTIIYRIVGIEASNQELSFALQSTR
jgi:phage baseplate assembly protein W